LRLPLSYKRATKAKKKDCGTYGESGKERVVAWTLNFLGEQFLLEVVPREAHISRRFPVSPLE
jgi:hypothetical protein